MVKIVRTTPAGREAVLIIHGPNSIFGDGFLSGRMQRGVTATAIEDTSVIRVEAAAMRLLLREEPQFSEFYIGYLVDRKIRTEFSLVDQLTYSSEQRLASALLQITDVGDGEAPRTVGVKISQETLADMVGTTRSRISFFMNKFRRAGFIEYKGHLRVHRDRLSTVLDDRSSGQFDHCAKLNTRLYKIDHLQPSRERDRPNHELSICRIADI